MTLLKVSLVIFMAGNLLDMGLRLDPREALRGLRNLRFVSLALVWGFVLGPALAWAIPQVIPLDRTYATGLVLMGMTPCAPFLPLIVGRAKGDLGHTAALMLLTAIGTVLFMPVAVPRLIEGLPVSAWTIAKPLVLVILTPLVIGMAILRASAAVAGRVQSVVQKTTGLFTIVAFVLLVVVYGKGLLGVAGSLAVASQVLFFSVVTFVPYWLAFGLPHEQKIVLSGGMATRNLGAAIAPLLSVPGTDQRAAIMVVLGFPLSVLFAVLATRWLGRPAPAEGHAGAAPA
jgi:BASS family bile acid:Na+ symporter